MYFVNKINTFIYMLCWDMMLLNLRRNDQAVSKILRVSKWQGKNISACYKQRCVMMRSAPEERQFSCSNQRYRGISPKCGGNLYVISYKYQTILNREYLGNLAIIQGKSIPRIQGIYQIYNIGSILDIQNKGESLHKVGETKPKKGNISIREYKGALNS